MNDNGKKYRRSVMSIACYAVALLMLLYIVYLVVSTASQIGQYYAQYDMKAQPMEYFAYIMQAIMEPLINTAVFFMLGYILDEVRKNNPAYYLSDEELEQIKAAKQEAKVAKQEERAARKAAAAEEAAAAKAEPVATAEMSVEEDFVRSLDEELNKDAVKKAPRKKSGSSQKKTGENKQAQNGQKSQNSQNSKSEQTGENNKKTEGAKSGSGSSRKRSRDMTALIGRLKK